MTTATVADVVAFEAWPAEQQALARRVLFTTKPLAKRSDVEEIKEDLREAEYALDAARRALVLLEAKIR